MTAPRAALAPHSASLTFGFHQSNMISFDPKTLDPECAGEYMWQNLRMRKSPLSAEDLMGFAAADLTDGDSARHLGNALSNAKKALHMRLEDVCLGFGCGDLSKFKTFPSLIAYARNCGIVAPRVLDRLNRQRNAVEHEYAVPKKDDVETFIDVVELFLAATNRWEWRMPVDVAYYAPKLSPSDQELYSLSFDWGKGLVRLKFNRPNAANALDAKYVTFTSPSEEFFQCVRFAIENDG